MKFNISKFSGEFKNTIDWMLRGTYAQKVIDDLQHIQNNKILIEKDHNSVEALKFIIVAIRTNSWRLKKPEGLDSGIDSFVSKYNDEFRTSSAIEDLIALVGNRRKKNIDQLLAYPTLKDFTDKLYDLAKKGKTEVLGEKGRDNYLRDFGHWDRIPIDRHEMRFIIRTGIYHACSRNEKSDHLEKSDLQDALTRFCTKFLNGYQVQAIELGNAAGIVDVFIWSFSAEDRYNICGATPKCKKCNLIRVCLYALTNLA